MSYSNESVLYKRLRYSNKLIKKTTDTKLQRILAINGIYRERAYISTRCGGGAPVLLVLMQPTCCWTGNMMRDLKVNSQTPASSPHESTTLDLMHPSTSLIVLCRYDIYDNIVFCLRSLY